MYEPYLAPEPEYEPEPDRAWSEMDQRKLDLHEKAMESMWRILERRW